VGAKCLQSETTQRLLVRSNFVKHPKTAIGHTCGEVPKSKLLDEVRARIHRLNYSIRTGALRFLYRQVLKIDESLLTDVASVRQGKR